MATAAAAAGACVGWVRERVLGALRVAAPGAWTEEAAANVHRFLTDPEVRPRGAAPRRPPCGV